MSPRPARSRELEETSQMIDAARLMRIVRAALAAAVLACGLPLHAQTVSLRIGCTNPAGSVVTDPIDRFVTAVAQKSNGKVVARNYYQALGIEQRLAQSVMSGTVDIGTMTGSNAATFTNAFLAFDLPFLFKSYDSMLAALDGPIGRKQVARFEKETGLKVLAIFGFAAGRDVQTRKTPLKVPADIKGLKIRTTSSPIELATYRAWGANPTPVDFAQTLTALQQGTIDGLNLDTPAVLATKMYEAVKYNLHLGYQMSMLMFFMNAQRFDTLAPDQQQAIVDAAKEAEAWNRKDSVERLAAQEKELAGLGVIAYTPSPAEWAQWSAVRDEVWSKVEEAEKGKLDLTLAKQLSEAQR
jgi:tripartite ATP-independent transporter DctP family solute receptor